jgi:hypothetical protein
MQEARSFAPPPRGGFALSWGLTPVICALAGKKIHARQKTHRNFRQYGCRLTIASSTQRAATPTINGQVATFAGGRVYYGRPPFLRFMWTGPGELAAPPGRFHYTPPINALTERRKGYRRADPALIFLVSSSTKLLRALFSASSAWAGSDGFGIRRLTPTARHALYYLDVLAVLVLALEAEKHPAAHTGVGSLLGGVGAEVVP